MHKKICITIVCFMLLLVATVIIVPSSDTEASYARGISRANCQIIPLYARNESITWEYWWLTRYYYTMSFHMENGWYRHLKTNGWNFTWADVPGDFDWQGRYIWSVYGLHYYFDPYVGTIMLPVSYTTWCNLFRW